MSNEISVDGEDLPPGQIELFDACYPPLQSGTYRLVINQTVKNVKDEPDDPKFERSQMLSLTSPRFILDACTVQMVYPPADHTGNFNQTMANIVLTRRTLLWERPIDPTADNEPQDHTPWMALLTIYDDEIGNMKPRQMTVAELLSPTDASVLPPNLGNTVSEEEKKSLCLGFDVDASLFGKIAPKVEELNYLNHVRQVNTDGKEVLGIDEEGWYSVAVSNRMVKNATINHVYLVSLEGQKTQLPGGGGSLNGKTKIRFPLMASWKFTAEETPGDFLGILQAIPDRGGIDLMHLPNRTPDSGSVPDAVNKIIDIGYTSLNFNMRNGEKTNAWYRGPMVAQPTPRETSIIYTSSDQAIRYDSTSGLFDMSYAASWQIGRLLALSDAAFAKSYYQWRIDNYTAMDAVSETKVIAEKLGDTVPYDFNLDKHTSTDKAVTNFLVNALSKTVENIPKVTSRHEAVKSDALPGVLSQDELNQHIETGQHPVLALVPKIIDLTE